MNAVLKPITFDSKRATLADIKQAVADGVIDNGGAFSIVSARISKRQAEKRALIPSVVEYRNELAKGLGITPIPVPVYASKQPAANSGNPSIPSDAKGFARLAVDSGIDPMRLVTELTSLVAAGGK
jgi:hypothetical protein